jgi:ankyrin repeat protein
MDHIEETRVAPDVERFLRAARAGDVGQCKAALDENPKLIDSIEAGGYAALHFAAFSGSRQLIDMLATFKPTWDIKNYDGNTPLMLAAKMKQHDAITRLVELGADVNAKGRGGTTAAHHAAAMGNTATLRLLASLGARLNDDVADEAGTVLHWACHSGDIDVVGTLIHEYNADVNSQDGHGGTPLFVACHLRKSDVILFLLEHGANPNVAAKDKSTPLHFAAEHGTLEDVKNLLAFGARADAVDDEGNTPIALAEKKGNKESLREMQKPAPTAEKKAEDAARFKAHGNKVFMDGENVKASRFYSLAIAYDPTNHVFFSNRSACHFNMRQYVQALYDAKQCIRLNPKWPKGYFRLASTLNAMKQYDQARTAVAKGLALDASNADLKALEVEMAKK